MDENLSSYLRSVRPPAFTLLGESLLPFSLGHHTLLAALDNHFVVGEEQPGFFDLVQGVYVCSRPYNPALRGFDQFMRQVERRLRIRKLLIWMRLLPLKSASVPEMISAFSDYLLAHSSCPEITPNIESEGSRQLGSPLLQIVKVLLMSRFHHTNEEAMNYPWGEALHDVATYWEIEGRMKIASAEDRAVQAEHLELMKSMQSQLEELERRYCH